MAHANVVPFPRRPQRKPTTMAQWRQRELAWILYITEGYHANLAKALAVNCVTFDSGDLTLVANAVARAEMTAKSLRALLARIEK